MWNFPQMVDAEGQWKSMWSRDSSELQPNGQTVESINPFLTNLSLVLSRLCSASQANILHFFGVRDDQISLFPKQVVPPKFRAK
jgi:hypothetical protein